MKYKRLGEMLVDVHVISEEQLQQALDLQKDSGQRLGSVLVDNGFITEAQLIETLRMQLGIEFVDLSTTQIEPKLVNEVPKNIARKYRVVPVRVEKDTLYLAMEDPLNFMAIESVRETTRKKVVPMIAYSQSISRALNVLYENEGAAKAMAQMREEASQAGTAEESQSTVNSLDTDAVNAAPTVRLANSIIERAIAEKASDIHVEPGEKEVVVRLRIDGRLQQVLTIPKDLQNSVISRLKVMGNMDIAERRIPQDGRSVIRLQDKDVDLRLSTLPTIHGEKVVIRLLAREESMLSRRGIGITENDNAKFDRLLKNTSGVILIVGPTGSGKSSTMYTLIKELKSEEVNMITLEDPVEYQIDGITQVQINEKTGMTFANALRACLRQDPDIIGVGEIRDGETAEIAMRAAMTGHLVISTIHTEDAVSAIDRLKDMGVEPYLIAGGLRGVISQRLVRRICTNCREEFQPDQESLELVGMKAVEGQKFYKGKGCHVCFNTGYRGRIGVFEVLVVNSKLRDLISEGCRKNELREAVESSGFVPMIVNGRKLVEDGVTTVEELIRTISIVE